MASTTTTYLVLTVLAAAACLLGPGVHACYYPVAEGSQNITFGTKGPKDVQLHDYIYTMKGKPMTLLGDFCYPEENSKGHVLITHYTVEALNAGLVYLNKEERSDEHRVCFHLKPLKDGAEFKVELWGSKY